MARQRKTRPAVKPKPMRGNRIRGDGKDAGRYFRCGFCGFICDTVDRDDLGGPEDESNITPTAYTQVDQYGDEVKHCHGNAATTEAACVAAGGTWTSTRYQPVVNAYCPNCGSPNNG